MIKRLKFDKLFWQQLKRLTCHYINKSKSTSLLYLLLIIFCTVGFVKTNVAINKFNQDFINALQSFNVHSVMMLTLNLAIVMLFLMIFSSYVGYFAGLLSISWRKIATELSLEKWINSKNYYHCQLDNHVDNPDQRIAEDFELFPEMFVNLFTILLNSLLTLVTFGYTLWVASVPIKLGQCTYKIPGLFFFCALIFACIGTFVINWIGRKLSLYDYNQQNLNANFRFKLISLQENSESIAFLKGESIEKRNLKLSLNKTINNSLARNKIKKNLDFFSNGYTNFGMMIGALSAAPFYLNKQMDIGKLMLVSGAFGYLLSAFSIFVNGFKVLASWRATIHRLAEFDFHCLEKDFKNSKIIMQQHDESNLKLSDLTLYSSSGKKLITNLNINFSPAIGYLIKGDIGVGKSTLFKAIAGLWHYGSGHIILPTNLTTLFVPQKPYLFIGTLKENLLYPSTKVIRDEEVIHILNQLGLGEYSDYLNTSRDWNKISQGQKQLVSIARIFFMCPDIIFLDEVTSAMGIKKEKMVYSLLRQQFPQAMILSIGHRKNLDQFHEKELIIRTSGFVTMQDIKAGYRALIT